MQQKKTYLPPVSQLLLLLADHSILAGSTVDSGPSASFISNPGLTGSDNGDSNDDIEE